MGSPSQLVQQEAGERRGYARHPFCCHIQAENQTFHAASSCDRSCCEISVAVMMVSDQDCACVSPFPPLLQIPETGEKNQGRKVSRQRATFLTDWFSPLGSCCCRGCCCCVGCCFCGCVGCWGVLAGSWHGGWLEVLAGDDCTLWEKKRYPSEVIPQTQHGARLVFLKRYLKFAFPHSLLFRKFSQLFCFTKQRNWIRVGFRVLKGEVVSL